MQFSVYQPWRDGRTTLHSWYSLACPMTAISESPERPFLAESTHTGFGAEPLLLLNCNHWPFGIPAHDESLGLRAG